MTLISKRIIFISLLGIIGTISAVNISNRFLVQNDIISKNSFSGYLAASNYSYSTPYGKYFSRRVRTPRGTFRVRFVTADLKNPKVTIITDTATSKKCKNRCPIKPLTYFYKKNKAFAAINGTYYCPYDYAACRGKTGWYFWRVFNTRSRTMLNQSNGFTRFDPLIAFDINKKIYYFHHALDFKKVPDFETKYKIKLQAAISGTELVYKRKVTVPKSKLDKKQKYVKSSRGSFGIKGTTVYLAVASRATVIDMASIMKKLGVEYAINLDGGGTSALMFSGKYKVGPGRNHANSIILGKKQ